MVDRPGPTGAPAPDHGVYGISVAAELSGISVQSLRLYERNGLLTPLEATAEPVATAPTTWPGCDASARWSSPESTWPASPASSTSKMTTPHCRRPIPTCVPPTAACVTRQKC